MKILKLSIQILALTLVMAFTTSCDDSIETPGGSDNLLPTTFSVAVPKAITNSSAGRNSSGRMNEDTFNGGDIYNLLGVFINIGEEAGDITEAIITSIGELGINRALTLSYQSDDDNRTKNLEVIEGAMYEGVNYAFRMTITDADSEGNDDGGMAMQIFWNVDPVVGISLLKPSNIDKVKDEGLANAIFRIDYSENGSAGYDAHMIVSIVDLPTSVEDQFAIDNLKLFVGKKGDVVDVFGNSNHPNATLFTEEKGFDWAFTASGIDNENIAVAEVGLPPITLNATDRATILEDYSIRKVFFDQIKLKFPNLEDAQIDQYLVNAGAPGYFGQGGFIQGGTSPGVEYDDLALRILELTPYNPSEINNLTVNFQR